MARRPGFRSSARAPSVSPGVICKSGEPWVRLTAYRAPVEPRRPGALEGQIVIGPDFDAADEEIIAAFENSRIFPGDE